MRSFYLSGVGSGIVFGNYLREKGRVLNSIVCDFINVYRG